MRRIIIHTLVILFILVLGISPFIVTAIAGTIATLPIALGVAAIYLLIVIIVAIVQRTRRQRIAPQVGVPPN